MLERERPKTNDPPKTGGGGVRAQHDGPESEAPAWTGAYTKGGPPCKYWNTNMKCAADVLNASGKCRGDHVCDQFYKDADGKIMKCKRNHKRSKCDRDNRCKANGEPI